MFVQPTRAIALAALAAVAACTQVAAPPPPSADSYWSLIRTDARGDDYLIDYDLTAHDCLDLMWENEVDENAWVCAEQPDGRLDPTPAQIAAIDANR